MKWEKLPPTLTGPRSEHHLEQKGPRNCTSSHRHVEHNVPNLNQGIKRINASERHIMGSHGHYVPCHHSSWVCDATQMAEGQSQNVRG